MEGKLKKGMTLADLANLTEEERSEIAKYMFAKDGKDPEILQTAIRQNNAAASLGLDRKKTRSELSAEILDINGSQAKRQNEESEDRFERAVRQNDAAAKLGLENKKTRKEIAEGILGLKSKE